jgi:hypothetical protein
LLVTRLYLSRERSIYDDAVVAVLVVTTLFVNVLKVLFVMLAIIFIELAPVIAIVLVGAGAVATVGVATDGAFGCVGVGAGGTITDSAVSAGRYADWLGIGREIVLELSAVDASAQTGVLMLAAAGLG